jgi:hypothetical protein
MSIPCLCAGSGRSDMRALRTLLVSALVLGASVAGQWPASAAGGVSVKVSCFSTPEWVRVTNNRSRAITVQTVGSIYQPYIDEPFGVSRKLRARGSIKFETGRGADTNRLSGRYIYSNEVGTAEGARVKTSVGTFSDRC